MTERRKIWSIQIQHVRRVDEFYTLLIPNDLRYPPFQVPNSWADEQQPQDGGWYEVYDDGHRKFKLSNGTDTSDPHKPTRKVCSVGHQFVVMFNHPRDPKTGELRCPHCMAVKLDLCLKAMEDAA